MKFKVKTRCHKGLARENMEDSAYPPCGFKGIWTPPFSVAVADGVGGLPGGEVASSIATRYVERIKSEDDIKENILHAHIDIQSTFPGSATTLTFALFLPDVVNVYWIGDSYAVCIDNTGNFQVITKPHIFPSTGYLTRVLGLGEPLFDTYQCSIDHLEHMLLFTDGFVAHFSLHQIVEMFKQGEDLIAKTLEAGAVDNMALVVVSKIA